MTLNIKRLNEILIEKKMNYSKLAEKAKMSQTQISRIVNKNEPRVQIKTISALSEALEVPYEELLISKE